VLGENHVWWEPPSAPGQIPHRGPTFWPDEAPHELSAEAYAAALATRGFQVCDSEDWEPDYEKIALYTTLDGDFSHAALLREPGTWTSKIGDWEDITHYSLRVLEGDAIGRVAIYMRRFRVAVDKAGSPPAPGAIIPGGTLKEGSGP